MGKGLVFESTVSMPSLPSLRSKLLEVLRQHDVRAKKLLDIGCGDGSLTLEVAKVVGAEHVYGVDVCEVSLEDSARKGIVVRRVDLDSEDLPFPREHFDLVLAVETIEHLKDTDHILGEIRRVLKRGCLMVLSTPNLCSYANRILVLLGYLPIYYEVSHRWRVGKPFRNRTRFNSVGHLRLYNLRAISDHLELSGFKIVKTYGVSIYRYNKIIKAVDRIFEHIPSLASGMIVLSKRVR